MKYVKTYEFFIFKRKKKTLDKDVLKELLESDLDGLVFRGNDILSNMHITNQQYYNKLNGSPKITKDTYFNREIEYSTPPQGLRPILAGGSLMLVDKDGKMGILIRMRAQYAFQTRNMSNMEEFDMIYKVFDTINKERMEDFGIGFCFFKSGIYPDSILFYSLS